MSMADKPQQVTITTEGASAKITVGDVDVSEAVDGYQIEHNKGSLPTIILVAKSPGSDLFDGLANVGVAVHQEHPGEAIAAFLSAIDPATLARAALDRDDLVGGKHELTVAMLMTLAEWAQGEGI